MMWRARLHVVYAAPAACLRLTCGHCGLQDTDGDGVVPEHQQVVLQYQGPPDDGVTTADELPVVLGRWAGEACGQTAKGHLEKLHSNSFVMDVRSQHTASWAAQGAYDYTASGHTDRGCARTALCMMCSRILLHWCGRASSMKMVVHACLMQD
jgi:hypothetical protein